MNDRPNILFLMSDQHNSKVTGYGGNRVICTPNIDRLAEEGIVFRNHYCQNPLCVPSRMSLLSGQYCRTTGIYDNKSILQANSVTLPRTLSSAGYRTCLIGKSHFNGEQFHGYQQRPYGDLYGQAHQPDPCRNSVEDKSGLGDLLENAGPTGIPLPLTQTEICVSETVKWLQAHQSLHADQSFFLSVHFDKPHFPFRCPSNFYHRYAGKVNLPLILEKTLEKAVPFVHKVLTNPSFHRSKQIQTDALASYYGCIEWVDDAVGRILDALTYLGLADNTMIIYTSDHGEMAGEKGAWQKTLFFDASAKVPLIVRYPSRFANGRQIEEPTGLIDLFPTICELAQVAIPEQCEGVSLMPLLDGGMLERDGIYCESTILGAHELAGCMMRSGPWKYCYYLDGSEELYYMEEDASESNNLSADNRFASIREQLRRRVIEFWMPDQQWERHMKTPKMTMEKHHYPFSNQFVSGDGVVFDARP